MILMESYNEIEQMIQYSWTFTMIDRMLEIKPLISRGLFVRN